MMETFYVTVAPGPVVIVCNRTPLTNGTPGGYKSYAIQAIDKPTAKMIARLKFINGDDSDNNAWGK